MNRWVGFGVAVTLGLAILAAACTNGQPAASPGSEEDDWPDSVEGSVTNAEGTSLAGMRIFIVGGTAPFPEVDTDDPPTELSLAVIEESTRSVVQRHDLGRGLPITFGADLPAGGYYLHTMGFWTDEDVLFEFKLVVAEGD